MSLILKFTGKVLVVAVKYVIQIDGLFLIRALFEMQAFLAAIHASKAISVASDVQAVLPVELDIFTFVHFRSESYLNDYKELN